MPYRQKAIAFDVDPDSWVNLRQAFPEWDIEAINGATTGSLTRDWNPRAADLLVVGARDQIGEALGLCRGFRSQAGRANTPLPGQEALVRAALAVGAQSCMVLPVYAKDLVSMVARARAGNRPGRHTLGLQQPQREDPWRDEGGEA